MNDNLVKDILYRDNKLIIIFNEEMQDAGTDSFLNTENYTIENNNNTAVFKNLNVRVMKVNNKIVQFEFSNTDTKLLIKGAKISVGYIGLKVIRYVKSKNEAINNVCNEYFLGEPSQRINISNNATYTITEAKILNIFFSSNDVFLAISTRDFYIKYKNKIYTPIKAYSLIQNNLTLIFEDNLFDNMDEDAVLYVASNPISYDVFKQPIVGDINIVISYKTFCIESFDSILDESTSDLKNAKFIVEFTRKLNPNTICTGFDTNNPITIPAGSIMFNIDINNPNLTNMTINNVNLGSFKIYSSYYSFLILRDTMTTKDAILSLTEDKKTVLLTFSSIESCIASIESIEFIDLYPDEHIKDINNNYIDKSIIGVYQRPLREFKTINFNSIIDNPFNGQVYNANYLINIRSKENDITLGDISNNSKVLGYMKINGNLTNYQKISLEKINIDGNVIFDINEGNVQANYGSYRDIKI